LSDLEEINKIIDSKEWGCERRYNCKRVFFITFIEIEKDKKFF